MAGELRNVLFITADQWRGDCLGTLAHPCLKTPHLDKLAADGTLFTRHYAQTTPCGPSRASLYTGLYLHNHRSVVNGVPLDRRHSNVALEARKLGYDPVLFGYTDVSADPRELHPEDPALRTYEGVLPGMTPAAFLGNYQLAWRADLLAKGYDIDEHDPEAVFARQPDFPAAAERGPTFAPAHYSAEDSNSAFLTGEAIKYLSVRRHEPWFVHISYLAPHPPFVVPAPYHARYDPAEVPRPVRAPSRAAEARQHPWLAFYLEHPTGTGYSAGTGARDYLDLSEAETLQLRATYYGMMNEVDDQVGRLIAYLKEAGLYDQTLIVFTSDHGEQLGDHWAFAKYLYFDQTFHVPLVLRDPRTEADGGRGGRVEHFTENVDVMPTILDWLSGDWPGACDGESLLPFLRGERPPAWRCEAHWALDFRNFVDGRGARPGGLRPEQCAMTTIRDARYKYVHFTAWPPLFFDLEQDPQEFENRAEDPAYRDLVLDYAQKMLSWRMNHEDCTLTSHLLGPEGAVEERHPRR